MAASLSALIAPESVLEPDATERDALLRALSARAAELAGLDPERLHAAVLERERLYSTALGQSVAMPHVRWAGLKKFTVVLARTSAGIDFSAPDGEPVRLFLLIAGPAEDKDRYLKLMGRAAKFLRAEAARLIAAPDFAAAVPGAAAEY